MISERQETVFLPSMKRKYVPSVTSLGFPLSFYRQLKATTKVLGTQMIRGTSSTFPSWLANDFFTMNPLPFHPRPFIPSTIRNSPSHEPCSIHDRPSRRFGFLFFLYFLFFSRYDLPLRSEATRTPRGEFVFCTVEFLFIKGIDPLFHWDMIKYYRVYGADILG